MTNLPLRARAALSAAFEVGVAPPLRAAASVDGTRKYLFPAAAGCVETAWIPDGDRSTLCVSTQVGCRLRCRFCHTGRQGFQGHLSAGEILNQYRSLPERAQVTNVVVMGMGEPLDNLDATLRALTVLTAPWGFAMSPRRITVSTAGLLPALERLLADSDCHVAISLHSPFPDERANLMPVERAHPIRDVIAALRRADCWRGQRRLMFEYLVFRGLNDSPRHVRELARLLNGLPGRINLMRYHAVPASPLTPADGPAIDALAAALRRKGFRVTIRRSRGEDIAAACGQLSTQAGLEGTEQDAGRAVCAVKTAREESAGEQTE